MRSTEFKQMVVTFSLKVLNKRFLFRWFLLFCLVVAVYLFGELTGWAGYMVYDSKPLWLVVEEFWEQPVVITVTLLGLSFIFSYYFPEKREQ